MESKELTIQTDDITRYAMTPDRVVAQVRLIQEVMGKVMHDGEHYGKIPGCGPKPTLLKPGAEKLSTTFRLAPSYKIDRTDMQNGHREYVVTCTLTHIPTDQVFGQGVGSCSSLETKYRYRQGERKCPECDQPTIMRSKEEFGGGWFCNMKRGGCGRKFKAGDASIEGQVVGKEEYPDPADYWNTILKMAKKRAHIDAVLTATAASDIFTQDVEDLVDNGVVVDIPKAEPVKDKPKTKPKQTEHHDIPEPPPPTEEPNEVEPGGDVDSIEYWKYVANGYGTKKAALGWAKYVAGEVKKKPWHIEFKKWFAEYIAGLE